MSFNALPAIAIVDNIGRAVKDEHGLYGGGVAAKRIAQQLRFIEI